MRPVLRAAEEKARANATRKATESKIKIDKLNQKLLDAAEKGDEKNVIELMATDDININIKDENGDTPLMLAAYNGHLDVVILLTSSSIEEYCADINIKNKEGLTALSLALEEEHKDIADYLVKEPKIKVNTISDLKDTPLMWAVVHNYVDIVKTLLTKPDIDIKPKNSDGFTALDLAVQHKHKAIEKLIRNYAKEHGIFIK